MLGCRYIDEIEQKMKHIKLFETWFHQPPAGGFPTNKNDSSQTAKFTGFKLWGTPNDLAETIAKKKEFENFYTNSFLGMLGKAGAKLPKSGGAPLVVKNVKRISQIMDAFAILGETPQAVLDLADAADLATFRGMNVAQPGYYVLRNSGSINDEVIKLMQRSEEATIILPEETLLSANELQAQIDYIKLIARTMPSRDPSFFVLT